MTSTNETKTSRYKYTQHTVDVSSMYGAFCDKANVHERENVQ